MKKKRWIFYIGVPLVLALLSMESGVFNDPPPNRRIARLQTLGLPADGAALFAFLLREIPDVVSEVPCVCCDEVLAGVTKALAHLRDNHAIRKAVMPSRGLLKERTLTRSRV